jgi:hypothetical protein
MKPNLIKSTLFANGWRCVAILLASVCLVWVTFISSSAQLKTEKHVTSLQLGQAAEGARVTIISDEALNDYEAFRRGDRFYVRIPQAAFSFVQPTFHGDGFDDVQVQKVGDSVVISFKLQPGASARVDERSNHLDVIFTAPNRNRRASVASNPNSTRVNSATQNPRNQERQRAAAGPAPSDSVQTSRQRFATARSNESNETSRQPARRTPTEKSQRRAQASNGTRVTSSPALEAASPVPAQNSAQSYPTQSYPTPSYTPATAIATPSSSIGSKSAGGSVNSSQTSGQWFSANRKGLWLGALLLLALLLVAAAVLYRGRTKKTSKTREKRPLAQPKYDNQAELNELTVSHPEPAAVSASQTSEAPEKSDWGRVASRPAFASAAKAAAGRDATVSKPSISSVVAERESRSEEREVFEL